MIRDLSRIHFQGLLIGVPAILTPFNVTHSEVMPDRLVESVLTLECPTPGSAETNIGTAAWTLKVIRLPMVTPLCPLVELKNTGFLACLSVQNNWRPCGRASGEDGGGRKASTNKTTRVVPVLLLLF